MNRQSNHLTDRQIEEYISDIEGKVSPCATSGTAPKWLSQAPAVQDELIETHISECDACRKRVLEAERARLGVPQRHPAGTPYKECPGEEVLQEYATGLCPSEVATKVVHHAAHCDFCAPLLKTYIQACSADISPEANAFLGGLSNPQPKWPQLTQESVHKSSARPIGRLAKGPVPKVAPKFTPGTLTVADFPHVTPPVAWFRVAMAGGLLIALFFLSYPIVAKYQLDRAGKLLTAAFVENPNTDQRYTWAPNEFDIKLSEEERSVAPSDKHALVEVQYLAHQKQGSSNPKWLLINGRVALLNRDINAVRFLRNAYDDGLRDPSVEIDLAAAYFLRDTSKSRKSGQTAGQNVDETLDLLHRVLKEPKLTTDERATALFNLARAYESMSHWDQAVSIWDQYLALDSTGPWEEEARRSMASDQSKIPPPRPEGYKTPAYFEDHSSNLETQNSIEEYQDAALRTWVLDLAGSRAAETSRAVRRLADVLEEQHGDSWMRDFLNSRRPGDLAGVQALSAAITSNRRGLSTDAARHGQAAEKIFERMANFPGVLRSRFEVIYANQRLLNAQDCIEQAQLLDTALRATAYRWLQTQLALTQAVCLNRQANFKSADDMLEIGHKNAIRFRFHVLELRALALDAGMKVDRDCEDSWQTALRGLELYWQGASNPLRLYEFYSPMKQCLEKKNFWHAEEALERRMIAILEKEIDGEDRNVTLEETAHKHLELILTTLNEPAQQLTSLSLNKDPVGKTYLLPIKTELAELQLRSGNVKTALGTLAEAKDLVEFTRDDLIRLNFYRVQGDILLKLQQLDVAEAAYTNGLEIAERAFGSLKVSEKRLAWMKVTDEIYRGLIGVFLEQGRNEQALQLWEWYRSHPWVLEVRPEGTGSKISWLEIESEVRRVSIPFSSSDTRLIYAFIKDRIYIWTIGSAGAKMAPPVEIKQELMQQRIRDHAREIGKEDSNIVTVGEDSQYLFSQLLTPVIADLQAHGAVVVELDPLMNGLVLEALKSPEGWYFGQRYPVVYSPGLVKENDLRPFSHHPPTSSWVLNALTADDRSVMKNLKGIKVLNYLNMTPTDLSDRLADSEMFIFLGHGDSGALRISNRTALQAEDFPPQFLQKLQVAVLAACSSGSTRNGVLDTSNLVHAFVAGGVPAVIASQWDVSRQSTDRLIGSFYDHFEKGETAARSMLEARQAELRSKQAELPGKEIPPYYWAAFSLTGRAN